MSKLNTSNDLSFDPGLLATLPPALLGGVAPAWLNIKRLKESGSDGLPVKNLDGYAMVSIRNAVLRERRESAANLKQLKRAALASSLNSKPCPQDGLNLLLEKEYGTLSLRDLLLEIVKEARAAVLESDCTGMFHLAFLEGRLDGKTVSKKLGLPTPNAFYCRHFRKLEEIQHVVLRLAKLRCIDASLSQPLRESLRDFVDRHLPE